MKSLFFSFAVLLSSMSFASPTHLFFVCEFSNLNIDRSGKVLVGPLNFDGSCKENPVSVEKFHCSDLGCAWEVYKSNLRACVKSDDGTVLTIRSQSNHNVPPVAIWQVQRQPDDSFKGLALVNEVKGNFEMTCQQYFK